MLCIDDPDTEMLALEEEKVPRLCLVHWSAPNKRGHGRLISLRKSTRVDELLLNGDGDGDSDEGFLRTNMGQCVSQHFSS